MAGRGPVPSLCNGARAAGALQSHRPPTLPTRPLCPSCCYSLTSAPYPCAVAGIARGSPTPLMLRFPPRSPPSFSTTSHRQPHPPAPLGHCPDAASSSLGAAGAALLLLVVSPSAAAMRAVAGSDGSSLELFCAQISSSLDRTARRLTRAARPPRRDGRATPARPLDMASAVSTEQLVGMLGRRMRTSRRRCPSPRAADSPTSCLARSSSRVTELATPAVGRAARRRRRGHAHACAARWARASLAACYLRCRLYARWSWSRSSTRASARPSRGAEKRHHV